MSSWPWRPFLAALTQTALGPTCVVLPPDGGFVGVQWLHLFHRYRAA